MASGPKYFGPSGESTRYDWWESKQANAGQDMLATVKRISTKQSWFREQNLWHARLHGGVAIAGLTPTAYSRPAVAVQVGESVGLNVVENMCSSAQAEICQNRPKVTFVTSAGDYNLREKAEQLDKWVEGEFFRINVHALAPSVFLDSTIFGTGITKVFENSATNQIETERVFPWELYIDQADGLYAQPRCLYQSKYYDRDVLKRMFPSQAKKIEKAQNFPLNTGRDAFMHDTTADLVQVIEGWRLPNGKNDKGEWEGGRHIIAIDGATLLDEDWARSTFPFVFMRWLRRPFGFWGKGLAEQLAGLQKEINRLLIKIQRAFARLGITRIYVERGSKVNPAHLRAMDGDIVEYTGQKPVQETPPIVSPEIFNHLWRLEEKAYHIAGLSQMTSQGQAPPPGVDSGKAIRALLQNHSKRLIVVQQGYEQYFMDLAFQMVELGRDISRREGGYKVKYPTEAGFEEIDFADIDLDADSIILQRFPTNALSSNPGERWQELQELFNSGVITADKFELLADFPDLKASRDLNPNIASYKAIMARLTDIVKKGKPWTPDPFINVEQAKSLAIPMLLNSEREGVPEDRLQMLRDCIDELINPTGATPPTPAAGAAPGPEAGALPQPEPGPIPGQVAPVAPMPNPAQPQLAPPQ